ncbi:DUF982 domain-containing protein [Mesorhizobium sp. M0051]|uniref:DUF982 domain-containing protein n=1 Tax=unclassified Mesorhizobium TaxID=325217 RepID=UPI0003CE2C2B|nr:DUF982 domain-containing protein [Mesorhizobium sp. LNHC252B00]ESY64112.1 hypothetical protein X743_31915 [Mesorhizobium sp. LNHC252B00]
MSLHWFDPPVPISGKSAGTTYNVNNVEAASAHLFKWTKRGPKWKVATDVCRAALGDRATPQEARRCFRLAAIEEGVLLA